MMQLCLQSCHLCGVNVMHAPTLLYPIFFVTFVFNFVSTNLMQISQNLF